MFEDSVFNTFFHLPEDFNNLCDKYYLLYWRADYTADQLYSNSEKIIRENIIYYPKFLGGLNKWLLLLQSDQQLKLSFRRLKGHETGIVLIKSIDSQELILKD